MVKFTEIGIVGFCIAKCCGYNVMIFFIHAVYSKYRL